MVLSEELAANSEFYRRVLEFHMTLFGITSSLRDWAATIRKWKEFRRETGTWPFFSIVASSLHTIGFVVGVGFLIWYGGEHRWSNNHFGLILLVSLLPYVVVWARLQGKIYSFELRRRGRLRGSNPDFRNSHSPIHHKSATARNNTARTWSQLVGASWHIDNAIFIVFIVFFRCRHLC